MERPTSSKSVIQELPEKEFTPVTKVTSLETGQVQVSLNIGLHTMNEDD